MNENAPISIIGLNSEGIGANLPVRGKLPTVSVFGCGGCGINEARIARNAIGDRATFKFLDTSHANIRHNEDLILIATHGHGSGKVRSENADPIVQEIGQLSNEDLSIADVNIICFSMSGGTGSVLGPVLLRDIARRTRQDSHLGATRIVAVAISDTNTEKSTNNTLNTLKTLESISVSNKLYMPVSIFSNGRGQHQADIEASNRIINLIQILTYQAAEVDRNDRIGWLNGTKTADVAPGLRTLHITTGEHGSDVADSVELFGGYNGYIFDTSLHIFTQERLGVNIPYTTRATFNGIWTSSQDIGPMLGVVGNKKDTFSKLTDEIQKVINVFASESKSHSPVVEVDRNEVNEQGLIL
jgi:hypothetical protein